jgi:hypothetical protein
LWLRTDGSEEIDKKGSGWDFRDDDFRYEITEMNSAYGFDGGRPKSTLKADVVVVTVAVNLRSPY